MIVVKVEENFTSQIPSCWIMDGLDGNHPPLPNNEPPVVDRLQPLPFWSMKQCPHCGIVWNRDVNACRYLFIDIRNIGYIFQSLQNNGTRPGVYGPPGDLPPNPTAAL